MSRMSMKLKLLVDKESKKVVFAEAGKEFVDFLMGLMELPLGSILRALSRSDKIEALSLGKVYQSARELEESYLQKSEVRKLLLEPTFTPDAKTKVKKGDALQQMVISGGSSYYNSSISSDRDAVDGYVKGAVIYMVMDDLTIKPFSTISTIEILNTFVKDMGKLEERVVQVDNTKALELVRAAFQSSAVLTDVFLGSVGVKSTRCA